MIDRETLLADLQKLLARIEADLLERSESDDVPDVGRRLRAEYERAKTAERTAQNFEDWRSDWITQHGAAWLLSCVFVRFLEDNRLIEPARIAGPAGERLQRARDEHELYFRSHPRETDREYLLALFDELAKLPGTKDVFGPHNPVRELPNWLSGDAATELLRFFQKVDANTGLLVHDFTDPPSSDRTGWDTRFLGDLYQDLSEAARKKYALLQTPEFVEEFILDRTLDPALDEFGLEQELAPDSQKSLPGMGDRSRLRGGFRMIDPACGSGHFLLGAFPRLLGRWQKREPGTHVRELVQRALDSIYGVDINPYAVAIARFRLLLAAMRASGITRLADAPAFHLNIVCGDSLLHAPLRHGGDTSITPLFEHHDVPECSHAYAAEDLPLLKKYLAEGQYHAVVANPPYITPKDAALNQAYRDRYATCHRKYSLAVPFLERIYRLATDGGYTGQITANSFMKREFGKKLIEEFLPRIDLTHVIDTSGAYIPGHGTPTVILFGRRRPPVATTIRAVMGIRGEPSTPDNPALGLVWLAIAAQMDQPGSQSPFVSVGDSSRELFAKHPWSIGGGGAAELKDQLDQVAESQVNNFVDCIGFGAILGEDDAFGDPVGSPRMRLLPKEYRRAVIEGEYVRDWSLIWQTEALFPYTKDIELCPVTVVDRWLWPVRTVLWARNDFSKRTYRACGRPFWEYHQIPVDRNRTPLSIAYGEVATHNHFVLDRGGKVFKQTAPIIKLPDGGTENDHLALLGLLNSSVACFWLKQVCHQKQMMGGDGIRIESKAKVPYAFNATQVGRLPVPDAWRDGPLRTKLVALTYRMDQLSAEYGGMNAAQVLSNGELTAAAIRSRWNEAQHARSVLRSEQVLLQEEIDFLVYRMFNLVGDDLLADGRRCENVTVTEGERPFCIFEGQNEDGFPVPSTTPADWPPPLRALWDKRIAAIRGSSELRLIENSMYKRRWIGRQGLFNHERTDDELGDAARAWLTDRLESYFDFDGPLGGSSQQTAKLGIGLVSTACLTDAARKDVGFVQVGELWRDDPAFDMQALVTELVGSESVPLLPVLTYKASGLRKRAEWEQTWASQRREDAGEEVDAIAVPPKFDAKDFLKTDYNRLRGKLDVPKERWVSFPHCEGPDGTLVIAWAGYNHLQLARAISEYYVEVQERHGGRDDPRLIPLLACLIELLPWLKQWHNAPDPEFDNMRMGDYFESFINEEARQLGQTIPEIKAWEPPERPRGRGRRKG